MGLKNYSSILRDFIMTLVCFFLPFTGKTMDLPVELEGLKLHSRILSRDVAYSVIIPADVSAENSYPVLYLLHGIGGDNSSWLEYSNLARLMQSMAEKGDIGPMIMVMPDGYLSYYSDAADGSLSYETFFMTELMPAIDSIYPTISDRSQRAIAGFSMGGFGALSLGLRNRGCFTAVAGFSPSIRTDEQYSTEGPQDGWEKQWGRTFDGVGLTGRDRITPYYRARSPYHIIDTIPLAELDNLTLILDIGDSERSLTASNEQLHRRLLERGIVHSWTVRDGGHDFACWNAALPDALKKISAKFQYGKQKDYYRRDTNIVRSESENTDLQPRSVSYSKLYIPVSNKKSSRRYPIVYLRGDYTTDQQTSLVRRAQIMTDNGELTPVAFCFLAPEDTPEMIESQVSLLRASRRMRALVETGQSLDWFNGYNSGEPMFTAVVIDNPVVSATLESGTVEILKAQRRYPRLWINQTPDSPGYAVGSNLHIQLREAKLDHEFRVSAQETGGDLFPHWEEWLKFIESRFHI